MYDYTEVLSRISQMRYNAGNARSAALPDSKLLSAFTLSPWATRSLVITVEKNHPVSKPWSHPVHIIHSPVTSTNNNDGHLAMLMCLRQPWKTSSRSASESVEKSG